MQIPSKFRFLSSNFQTLLNPSKFHQSFQFFNANLTVDPLFSRFIAYYYTVWLSPRRYACSTTCRVPYLHISCLFVSTHSARLQHSIPPYRHVAKPPSHLHRASTAPPSHVQRSLQTSPSLHLQYSSPAPELLATITSIVATRATQLQSYSALDLYAYTPTHLHACDAPPPPQSSMPQRHYTCIEHPELHTFMRPRLHTCSTPRGL